MFVDLLAGGGLVFDEVCADLEGEGYEVQPFIIPAAGVNAPHKRERIWFIAHSNNKRRSSGFKQVQNKDGEISKRNNDAKLSDTSNGDVANTNNKGCQWDRKQSFPKGEISFSSRLGGWDKFPTQSPLCSRNDGISSKLDSITFPKWRKESIKAGGNAIVPQVAFEIFKAINKI